MGLESGILARPPGRDGVGDTGLFEFNRRDMTIEEMEERARGGEWQPGDLFAVFRDELGGMHVQYSHYDDFAGVAISQLIRTRTGSENVTVDYETMLYLVGMLMVSRIHGYEFDNFLDLRDHTLKQVFDLKDLCSWIARNENLFMTDAEAVMEDAFDDHELESLRDGSEAAARTLMGS